MTAPLSVAIITLNEEKNIGRCLAGLAFADEVVVVDSGSDDRTVEMAANAGARVIEHEWLGFGPQKRVAVEACRNDWVLILDADEEVTPQAADEITAAVAGGRADAFFLPRRNFIRDREIRHGSWRADKVLRLFRKSVFEVTPRLVHEEVTGSGRTACLPDRAAILHRSFASAADFIARAARYAPPGAEELAARGEKGSIAKAMAHGAWSFVFGYFVRLGFLDGGWGAVIAFSEMVGTFYKYAILWDTAADGRISRQGGSPRSS